MPGFASEFFLELNEALSNPALGEFDEPLTEISDAARLAAYELTVAVGRCRLFVPDSEVAGDYVLTQPVAEAASQKFRAVMREWIEQAKRLGEDFDAAESFEDVDRCADMLLCRMEAWAAFTALDEAFQETLEGVDRLDTEGAVWMEEVLELLEELDETLLTPENMHLLSTVAAWPLLDNVRATLAGSHKEVLPWWLDGRLEEIAGHRQPDDDKVEFGRPVSSERRASTATNDNAPYILAAGSAGPSLAIIDRLASATTEDVVSVDYRRAWAHFLASTYRGTSCRDEWRKAFVALASEEDTLERHWMERVARAKALTEERDWKRRYDGEKVYALEPIPLKDVSGFLKLLADLADPEAAE